MSDYRHLISHDIHWKTACRYIRESLNERLVVNESKIDCHKENYFRFYINGNPLHYIGVLLNNWGEVLSYDFMAAKIVGDTKISNYGWWRGEKKEVADLLGRIHSDLKTKGDERNDNENRLLTILDKFVLRILRRR